MADSQEARSAAQSREYRRRLVRSALTHPHVVVYRAIWWCYWKSWRTLRWPLFYVIDPSPLSPEQLHNLQAILGKDADAA
jgi:hypothetical protein